MSSSPYQSLNNAPGGSCCSMADMNGTCKPFQRDVVTKFAISALKSLRGDTVLVDEPCAAFMIGPMPQRWRQPSQAQ